MHWVKDFKVYNSFFAFKPQKNCDSIYETERVMQKGRRSHRESWAPGRIVPMWTVLSPRHGVLGLVLLHVISEQRHGAGSITFDLQMTKENKASKGGPLVSNP